MVLNGFQGGFSGALWFFFVALLRFHKILGGFLVVFKSLVVHCGVMGFPGIGGGLWVLPIILRLVTMGLSVVFAFI